MKLRKQNYSGSISVLIPKYIINELGWQVGEEINVSKGKNSVIITRSNDSKTTYHNEGNELLNATALWCDLSNAIIRKYKQLSEEDPNRAIAELRVIKNTLLTMGLLNEGDLDV